MVEHNEDKLSDKREGGGERVSSSFHSFTLSFPAGKKREKKKEREREREREREKRYMYMIQKVIEECMYTKYTYI